MADYQKIHPVHDPEAPPIPTALPVSCSNSKSDKGNTTQPPQYSCTTPLAQEKPPKKRSCLCKCLFWTILLLVLIIITICILAAIVYLVYQPKIPKYSVNSLTTTKFNLNNNMSLYATFNVNITLTNPNKKIGIYYESGSDIKGFYLETQLCQGSLPRFYQGHRNTTVLDVPLTGQTENATELLQSLQLQQQTGSIPLKLRAKVPVRIKLGFLKLMTWKFLVRCNLVVNSLSTSNTISLRSSDCKFRFRL